MGAQLINRLDASTLSGRNSRSEWRFALDPTERNCLGVRLPIGWMRGACRLVFVFLSRENPISRTSNRGSKRENSCNRVGTPSGENPIVKSFDSHKLIEKGHVGKSSLPSPSRKNPISRAYKYSPLSGGNHISGRTNLE